jgi:hypothetical protein
MILRFFPQPDSPHIQIFRKAGQKKAEPNRPIACLSVGPEYGGSAMWSERSVSCDQINSDESIYVLHIYPNLTVEIY